MNARHMTLIGLAAAGLTAGAAHAGDPAPIEVDITGIESWDALGDPSNTVLTFDLATDFGLLGGGWSLTGVGWDVTISTVGLSWLSEASVGLGNTGDAAALFLSPGAGTDAPMTGAVLSSGGILDLTDNAIPDIDLTSGSLTLEFFDGFDDVADAIDATWDSGSIFLQFSQQVPTPGALALLGLAGLTGRRRRH